MLKNALTYEIMTPESVGLNATSLVMGKHSGRHAFKKKLEELGYGLGDNALNEAFVRFIALADKKKEVYDTDIVALIENRMGETTEHWQLTGFHTSAGTDLIPTATIRLTRADEDVFCDAAIGDGPIDAVFNAMERIVGVEARLEDFQVRSVSHGKDALGEVAVILSVGDRTYHGKGVSTDIIEAAARAYLKALNAADSDRRLNPVATPKASIPHGV